MKKILLATLATLSFSAFSQSYFVLENGVTLSTDVNGYVYDMNHYTPVNRVSAKGGQFLMEDSNVLVTVNDAGALFRKYEILPPQIKGKGMNYFIGDNNSIYTIDTQGLVNYVESDEKMGTASKFGGNYFVAGNDELYTVSTTGAYQAVAVDGLKPVDIISLGGNYFMTNRGALYTVSGEGKVSKTTERVSIIVKKGGNYFIDTTGMLYTVSRDGALKLPALPVSLRIQAIAKLGANYFLDASGKLFTVDKDGNVFERWTNYDLKTTKIISL